MVTDIMICKEDDSKMWVPRTLNGFNTQYILPSEAKKIIEGLKLYCKQYSDDYIELLNYKNRKEFEESMHGGHKVDKNHH